ncbi:MAG: hypothetical protein JST19_07395 [Bacteroidetes bacterium]|nr:hypothetical protein [Bacteroidota bacterium]
MKKLTLLLIAVAIGLLSCTKKGVDPAPVNSATDTVVTIGGGAYPVVRIGSQSWTAVNYTGPGGVFNSGNPLETPLDGKLYTPAEAAQINLPAGWHIPTYNDYLNLLIARGATKESDGTYTAGLNVAQSLMAESGWSEGGGNNYSKFNALPTGFYHLDVFYGSGNGASFLHSLTAGTPPDEAFTIGPGPDGQPFIYLGLTLIDGDRCSIRFVKNN